ncbi:P-loop containing nucleoside triphosphate hydrolase protein [Fomitopsis serialis]|uniref:P-loop containing nucleoside triphosphate hydrolase protein n=1 Tax=Fomitopsis serialis TaxID=139415 RepID=UPI002007B0D8|nr:P-loop containing nucleoside triphosphate hydrolase protein [Neoantrodia serialis]KAH9932350.1 P-loop containing nucleoside triphosphate hydrolase protein [Neoantrodia serialis]
MMVPTKEVVLSAESGYALRRKELLALVKKLRASGAQADLDLPRVAVIGNQSAGKSSLVEAISGITVPRDAGTCTRCPMECRLSSSSEPWRCQVSIRWEFDSSGKRRNEVQEVTFGGAITNKADVELMLRRAQAAVLNPDIPAVKFVTMSADSLNDAGALQKKRLLFSRNVVCIDLAGPDLTDLSFVDLPGIIQNADPEVVQLVENLVMSHIKGNCLILVTCPMSDDIDNQKALRLARDVDPSGLRTIGVLTKPDTLTAGAIKQQENWLDVLEGRNAQHRLTHGYFCTRQPDDADRRSGITASKARISEAAFFSKTAPWSQSSHQHRFGTPNLVKTLSALLTHIIDDSIPKLQKEVVHQLTTCRAELDALPPAITADPASYVLSLITSFCGLVVAYVQGGPSTAHFVQQNRVSYAAFKRAVRGTAPPFLPFPSAAEAPGHALAYLGLDLEEEEDGFQPVGETPAGGAQTKRMYLRDVKQYIARSITRELPNNVPYPAKVALIKDFQSSWGQLCQEVFDNVGKDFQDMLSELMRKKFQRYSLLHSRVNSALQELLISRRDAALIHLQSLLKLESTPFTQNSHYLSEKTSKTLARFKDARSGKDVMMDEIRRFHARKQTGAPSKRPEADGTAAQTDQNPFNFAGLTSTKEPFSFGNSTFPTPSTPTRPSNAAPAKKAPAGAQRGTSKSPTRSAVPTSPTPQPQAGQSTSQIDGLEAVQDREKLEIEALALLTKLGYKGLKVEDLGKLNPPDEFEEEMQVMAEVRAYFHVAYKRVIDYIPLSIDHLFLYGLSERLQDTLIEKLGLGSVKSTERCAAYLSEDANVVAARTELLGKRERLESVQKELDNFMYA